MDEQELIQMMMGFGKLPKEDMGQGDYEHFLAQYANAMNRRADEEQLQALVDAIPGERRQAMVQYGGMPQVGGDPYVNDFRNSLNNRLRGY